MSTVIVTGSGGLIGSEAVAPFRPSRLRRGRDRERHARPLLRAGRLDRRAPRRACRTQFRGEFRSVELDIRDADGVAAAVRARRRRPRRGRSTPPRSPRTTGRRRTRRPTSRVNANGTLNLLEATRQVRARGDVHLHLDQQGLRRHAELPAARGRRRAARAARGSPLLRRHRHVDVDRRVHALAVRRLQGGGGPDGPGVRPLLRHADGLLPRRLPDRARSTRARSCTASSPT